MNYWNGLKAGKVYVPEQAQTAMENFFRKGNLIALRELALRYTAERVVAEMETYRQSHAIKTSLACSGAYFLFALVPAHWQ